jgi:hypothetical protein
MNPSIGLSNKAALWVGFLIVLILLLSSGNIEILSSESAMNGVSESYSSWVTRLIVGPHGVLNAEVIRRAWEPGHGTAPFSKTLGGVLWSLGRVGINDTLAHRLASILLTGILAAVLYRLLAVEIGFWAGLAAVIALFTMPRFFLWTQTALPEAASATMMTAAIYVFWRNKESARLRYALLLGVLFGLAVSTDLRALLLIPILLIWILFFRPKFYLFLRVGLAWLVAAAVFFLLWPWLYYDTASRLTEFFQTQFSGNAGGPFQILGQSVAALPWFFPFLLVWAIIPMCTLLLFVVGVVRTIVSRRARGFGSFLFLLFLVPLLVYATGKWPMPQSDRILVPFLPFLAALCGMGFAWLVQGVHFLFRRMHRPAITVAVSVLLLILLFALPVYQAITLYPDLLSYYSEQAGGLPGAQSSGLEISIAGLDNLTESLLATDSDDSGCTSRVVAMRHCALAAIDRDYPC